MEEAQPIEMPVDNNDHLSLADLAAAFAPLSQPVPTQEAVAIIEEVQTAEEPPSADQAQPLVNSTNHFEDAYVKACNERHVEPVASHLEQLKSLSQSFQLSLMHSRQLKSGGAVLNAANSSQAHTAAFIESVCTKFADGNRLIIDHLDLSGSDISVNTMELLVKHAAASAPLWYLRSLDVSNSSITFDGLKAILSLEALQFISNLQRLDLSGCKELATMTIAELCHPEVFFLFHFWRFAPLKYLDMTDTGISDGVLALMLHKLNTYTLPPTTKSTFGARPHSGARSTLEVLKLGSPAADGTFEDIIVTELKKVIELVPTLQVIELKGVKPEQIEQIQEAWTKAHTPSGNVPSNENDVPSSTALRIVRPHPDIVRMCAGRAAATDSGIALIEASPTTNIPLAPITPQQQPNEPTDDGDDYLEHYMDWEEEFVGAAPRPIDQQQQHQYNEDAGNGGGYYDDANNNNDISGQQQNRQRRQGGAGGQRRPRQQQLGGTGAGRTINAQNRVYHAGNIERGVFGGPTRPTNAHRPRGLPPKNPRGANRPSGQRRQGGVRNRGTSYAAAFGFDGYREDHPEDGRQHHGNDETEYVYFDGEHEGERGTAGARNDATQRRQRRQSRDADDAQPQDGGQQYSDDDDGGYGNYDDDGEEYYSDDLTDEGEMDDYEQAKEAIRSMRAAIENEDERMPGPSNRPPTARDNNNSAAANPQQQNNRQSTAAQRASMSPADKPEQPFKLRDGLVDLDTRLGAEYRKLAKKLCMRIPDAADSKAAKRAYLNWDNQAINAWDRHRWDRPSKDQNDEPHMLGSLNRMFDLLAKHGLDKKLEFPFPLRVPGGGFAAYESGPVQPQPTAAAAAAPRASRHSSPPQPPRQSKPQSSSDDEDDAGPSKPSADQGQKSRPKNKKARRYVEDGGHGRDSDAEDDAHVIDGEFVVPDGAGESSSDSEEDDMDVNNKESSPVNLVSPSRVVIQESLPEEPAVLPAARTARTNILDESQEEEMLAAVPVISKNARQLLLEESDDDDDAEPSQRNTTAGDSENKRISRQMKELARLQAWAWDSRIEEQPRNEEVYRLEVSGKRARRSMISNSQILAFNKSESQEDDIDLEAMLLEEEEAGRTNTGRKSGEKRAKKRTSNGRKQRASREFTPAGGTVREEDEEESSSDDDTPLINIAKRTSGAGGASTSPADDTSPPAAGDDVPMQNVEEDQPQALPTVATTVEQQHQLLSAGKIAPTPLPVMSQQPPHQPQENAPTGDQTSPAEAVARALLGNLYNLGNVASEPQKPALIPDSEDEEEN